MPSPIPAEVLDGWKVVLCASPHREQPAGSDSIGSHSHSQDETAEANVTWCNPCWAFLDAVTNARYGSTSPIAKVDFNAVVSFADSRGDTFDYILSTAVAVPDALDKILTPARSRHVWLGNSVSLVPRPLADGNQSLGDCGSIVASGKRAMKPSAVFASDL